MRLPLILSVLALTALIFYAAIQTLPAADNLTAETGAIAEMEDVTAQIEAARAEFGEEAAILNKTIDDLKAENLNQTSTLEAALAQRDELQTQLSEAVQRLSGIEAENASLTAEKGELAQELATLTADIESREVAFRESEARTQALNDTIEAGHAEIAALQATIAEQERQGAELAEQLAELEGNATALATTNDDQVAEAQALLDQKTSDLVPAEERIALLSEMATAQVQTASELTGQIEDLELQIATLSTQTADLSDEVAKRDTVISGLMTRSATENVLPAASCQEKTDTVLAATQITFEPGTATIDSNSLPALEELATIATTCGQEDLILEIEGHTNEAGGFASNLLLSDGRAKAIRDFLVESGVPAPVVRAVGFGGSELTADRETDDGQSRNQRIVLDWEQS